MRIKKILDKLFHKSNPGSRLRSSTLILTIIIALILSVLCSSLILMGFYNRLSQKSSEIDSKLNFNLESATNLVLADSLVYLQAVTDSIDLFKEGNDSVRILKKAWGLLQVADVKAFHTRFTKSKTFFYGSTLPDSLNACLYMADHKRPLAISGNTKLIGDAFLPNAGLKSAYIEQRGYSWNKLIEGKIKASQNELPEINLNFFRPIVQLLQKKTEKKYIHSETDSLMSESLFRSFTDSALKLYVYGKINLSSCSFKGQILIVSDSVIEVDKSAELTDIILVAPVIKFMEGFKGKLQAFARDSIIVEDRCEFDYPSNLALIKRETETLQNRISIGEDCSISGNLVSVCRQADYYKSLIEIKKGTVVNGVIYAMGYLNLQGKVNGTVFTDYFIYKSPVTVYENHLVDAEINQKTLPGFFIPPSLLKTSSKKGIIGWLN